MIKNSILTQIELAIPELPISEQKVAQYILSRPKDVLKMTIHELAKEAQASSAAVVRLCKSIGVDGFPNLKMRLSAESVEKKPMGYLDIEAGEDAAAIIEKTISNTVQTFQDTANQLDTNALEKVVKTLKEADIIYVYGIGASFLVAGDVAQKWRRLGKTVFAISDRHLLASAMATQNENAVFWGISYSGETKEVLKLIKKAKVLGMKTIGLSRIGNNKLSQNVDVSLSTARAPEAKLRSAATSSRFAQLFVIDVVFLTYASSQYEFTVQQLEKSKKIIETLDE